MIQGIKEELYYYIKDNKYYRKSDILKTDFNVKEVLTKLNLTLDELVYRIQHDIPLDKVFTCKHCGKKIEFKYKKYNPFCNVKCANTYRNIQKDFIEQVKLTKSQHTDEQKRQAREKLKATSRKIYGCDYPIQSPVVKEKVKKTTKEHFGVEHYSQSDEFKSRVNEIQDKIKAACQEEFGVDNYSKSQAFKDNLSDRQKKMRETNLRERGVEYVSQLPEIRAKAIETKKKNNTLNSSEAEIEIKELLLQRFPKTIHQYHSELYPFDCDFYIPELDLYIEYHGHWTHGDEAFDKNNSKHVQKLNRWKSKSEKSEFFKTAVYVWTDLDVRKLETFKKNKLNYKVFYTVKQFKQWYSSL